MAEGGHSSPATAPEFLPTEASTMLAQGGIINQNFINCTFQLPARDHIDEDWDNGKLMVSNQVEKRGILARSIRSQLKKNEGLKDNHSRMEVYTAMYESKDDGLIKLLSVIDVTEIALSHDEAHIVGSLIAKSGGLNELSLAGCTIEEEQLRIITRNLADQQLHIDVLDFRCNFSARALHSLLQCLRDLTRRGHLRWKVVKLQVGSNQIKLKDKAGLTTIKGWLKEVKGSFDKTTTKLMFKTATCLDEVVYCGMLFEPMVIKIPNLQLYAKQDDLREISNFEFNKLSKILLDCTKETRIDWSLIATSVKNNQLELLDIVVDGDTSANDHKVIIKRLNEVRLSGVEINIHWMFKNNGNENDVESILEAFGKMKVGYIHCVLRYHASLEDITPLVEHCKSNQLTLIYWNESHMLGISELKKIKGVSRDRDMEVKVLKYRDQAVIWRILIDEYTSHKALGDVIGEVMG